MFKLNFAGSHDILFDAMIHDQPNKEADLSLEVDT